MPLRAIREFIRYETLGGTVLFASAILALLVDNSPWRIYYHQFFDTTLSLHVGTWYISKHLLHWVNDGLMAIFFMLVGLEIKREMIHGELNSLTRISLPAFAAVGGMVVPALIFAICNHNDPQAMRGWAIPTATDIAFSLGILVLLGKRVPLSLKVFMTALAIFDDLGAILIVALFYSTKISLVSLLFASLCILGLLILNRRNVTLYGPYFLIGVLLWFCVLKSGVHATLAGVVVAFAIPMRDNKRKYRLPLKQLERKLHPYVAFGVLPMFAFANAGVSFSGLDFQEFFTPVMVGIMAGLFIGKQIGIFSCSYLAIKMGWAEMPRNSNWLGIYGVALICGVGFTMSLFIGTLAYDQAGYDYSIWVRSGVIMGSALSGLMGYLILRRLSNQAEHNL